jgi:hypothetical protein
MRANLKVPFSEKDQAKKLGARWDAARKLWYIEGGVDAALFARWQPTAHDDSAPVDTAPRRGSVTRNAAKAVTEASVQVGSCFVERPRVCDCLPWDDCDRCRVQAVPAPKGGR